MRKPKQSTGNGASTLTLKPMGGVNRSPKQEVRFANFVCQNERIWTLWGRGVCRARPLDPPMILHMGSASIRDIVMYVYLVILFHCTGFWLTGLQGQ